MEKSKEIVVFTLRKDTVTGKNEGEYYSTTKIPSGIVNVSVLGSPHLIDHQIYICIGQKAIKEGFSRMELWIGHKMHVTSEQLIKEIKLFTRRNKTEPFTPPYVMLKNKVHEKICVDMFNRMNATELKKHVHATFPDTNLLIDKTIMSNKDTRLIFTLKNKK